MLVLAVAAVAAVAAFASGGTKIMTAFAGTGLYGNSGDGGPATLATFYVTAGVVVDGQGNVYISDYSNHRVRKVSPGGTISNFAGTGVSGNTGNGGPATSAELGGPVGLAVDGQGNLYIADAFDCVVRKVDTTGTISTVAGSGTCGFFGDGGPATSANLYSPHAVAVDSQGDIYIADTFSNRVRKVSPTGTITTFAGTGLSGPPTSGDGGPATSANMSPAGVAVDGPGNVYISDYGNNLVREVTPAGTISTFAGTGTAGSSGDGGPATSAELNYPMGIAVDGAGNVYVLMDYQLREVSGGTITTIADTADVCGNTGDGGLATAALICGANAGATSAVAVDGQGGVYIADWSNNRVRKIASPMCLVPKLKRKKLAVAKSALQRAHCATGRITRHKSSTVSRGRVISSRPRAGTKHAAGTKVALTVSRGKR